MAAALRLTIDFNYAGRLGDEGVVYLTRKSGNRNALLPQIQAQFESASLVPSEGLPVELVDPANDLNDEGILCDIVVEGWLTQIEDGRWVAKYPWDAAIWVPSEPD